jgi:hypothetical protein
MCNCGRTTNTVCTSSCQTVDCACPVKDLSTDCVLYTGNDLPCTEIKTGTLLTEVFGQLDTYLCDLSTQLANAFSLISVGEGVRVYKGVDGIGRKEIRSLTNPDGFISIGLSTNNREIELNVNQTVLKTFVQANQITYSASNVGTGAGIYKDAIRTADNVNIALKKIKSQDGTVIITEGTDDINLAVDGSETKVTAGTAISVSGNGTIATPYVVTNTLPDQIVSISAGTGISISGSYPTFSVTNTAPDQIVSITGGGATTVGGSYPNFTVSSTDTNTTYSAGSGISISGTTINNTAPNIPVSITGGGATTVGGSYPNFTVSSTDTNTTYSAGLGLNLSGTTFGVVNLQKEISGNYTLTSADTEYTIFINNGASPVTITVPTGLVANFEAGFIQEGTGTVTFSASGTTINTPTGFRIKGQRYQAFIEKKLSSETFYLLGNVIV